MANLITVEVAYATPKLQKIIQLELSQPANINDAILKSGILNFFPELNLTHCTTGIWGQLKPLTHPIANNDRIEIYRPLTIDPKAARLLRVQKNS